MPKHTSAIQPIYPYTEWEVVEEAFKIENNYRNETIFALGNGYLGIRGNFEEGLPPATRRGQEGTYINGFFESEVIQYPEVAYGLAEKSETMLNVTNGKVIKLFLEDEQFSMIAGTIHSYQRVLRLKEGLLERKLIWESPQGRQARIEIARLVSLQNKHLMAIHYQVTPLNFSGPISLFALLDGNVTNLTTENDPRVGSGFKGRVLLTEDRTADGSCASLWQTTKHTKFKLACTMDTTLSTSDAFTVENVTDEFSAGAIYRVQARENEPVVLDKYVAYVTSLDYPEDQVMSHAWEGVGKGKQQGFAALQQEQHGFLAKFWANTDVAIKGDPAIQQGIRFNMYHLLQSVGRDGRTNIAAKGLTGEGYEGHYFWDTETYVIPFFLYNNPGISRKLLEYRYRILDKARHRARQMAHPTGALFPWRTIDGEECSAYFPAGTAQYHIDADVAFAIKRYVQATGDNEFLTKYGAEILFETARLWADLGDFIPHKGDKFCINEVTGPDEYSAMVDNNCYTNLMAQENLAYAYEVARRMQQDSPADYARIQSAIGLTEDELTFWKKAADNMYIPYDEKLGIYAQDDSFLDKAPWDFEHTPPENYPLLIHYHPLVIYRYQVCKQADFVLALFLLSQKFTLEEKKRNYDFYEKITTHDSSLSMCTFSIVASEIGYHDKAYEYFMNTARMDLDDIHHNVKDGIHVANMAGTWMSLVNGFAGMRAYDEVLSFAPSLPAGWQGYSFGVTYHGCLLKITVDQLGTAYQLVEGDALVLRHHGQEIKLFGAQPVKVEAEKRAAS